MAFVGCAGLGNSSRCLSLFGHAHREGALVAVYAGKPAREYIRTNLPGVSLPDQEGLRFPPGRDLSLGRTLRSLPFLLTAALRNARTAWRELGKHRPDAIVVDSEYVAPLVAALGGIPIFSVNHARQSWSEWRRIRRSDRRGLVWNFYLLEGFEIVFYRLLSRAVLIPGISPELDGLAGPMCR